MKKIKHGGDIYTKRKIEGTRLIDFSANINPLGLPLSVRKAIIDNIDCFSNYPDPLCRELTYEIAKQHNLPEEYIVCGNGAADIIYRIAASLKPKVTLLTAPTFSEYEQAVINSQSKIIYHYLNKENHFKLDDSIFQMINPEIDIMFLCNPNNPTGMPIEKAMVLKIAECCKENGIILVVDECFNDFLENPQDYSVIDSLIGFENVIVLKAFTKIFAMAGIRLGYCLSSNTRITDEIYNAGQPWNVSVVAQKCGVAAIKEAEYLKETKSIIKENREYLSASLKQMDLEVFESKANYILFRANNKRLAEELLQYGILIRACDNFVGLDNTYYRIAVKSKTDNEVLIDAMKKCLL